MPVLVGTSGWQYRHWRDAFYPRDVPQRRWLEYYAGKFGTVENNGTFYRLPATQKDRIEADIQVAGVKPMSCPADVHAETHQDT